MNQHRTHQLRAIFRTIAPFPLSDPRSRFAWRTFKRDYLKQPRDKRASYMVDLRSEANKLLHEAKQVVQSMETVQP